MFWHYREIHTTVTSYFYYFQLYQQLFKYHSNDLSSIRINKRTVSVSPWVTKQDDKLFGWKSMTFGHCGVHLGSCRYQVQTKLSNLLTRQHVEKMCKLVHVHTFVTSPSSSSSSSLFLFSSHKTQLRNTSKWIYNHEGKWRCGYHAIKERKTCDWWHPACYIAYEINNIM